MGDLSAIMCKDNGDIHVLKNIHDTSAEGTFCDERGNAIKPLTVVDYNPQMYYVHKGDRMANSYSIAHGSRQRNCASTCMNKTFLTHPCEEHGGTCWTRAVSTGTIRETTKYCRQCWQTEH